MSVTGALTSSYHIAVAKLHNKRLSLEYNNTLSNSLQVPSYNQFTTHDQSDYTIGYKVGAAATNYFKGDMQEIIIYNSSLEDYTIGQIKSYLNKKYNIY